MITLVSGLPRSGTSMMMQMLECGGLPALTDHERTPDDDNPRGYFEFERVKKLKTDKDWLSNAHGKVVKVISMLLFHLPADHEFRIVFMKRPITEVLASQARMLARNGKESGPEDSQMKAYFEGHLTKVDAWLQQQPNIRVHCCNYHDVVDEPRRTALEVNDFLGLVLDCEKMAAAVDPRLHRQKG